MRPADFDIQRFKKVSENRSQYEAQLSRLAREGKQVDCIQRAVEGALANLRQPGRSSFVIYGEPQSGKTEMMICLTAKLLDEGYQFILHLLNDSVDLLGQSLGRFQKSGLAPAAKNFTDILDPAVVIKDRQHVVFCKKNARDLTKLLNKIGNVKDIVIVDDEADYASPNAKVNQAAQTKINELIEKLLNTSGEYVGVTATPARLDLNNTFDNDSSLWVNFPPHRLYTGQDTFFPLTGALGDQVAYQQSLLPPNYDSPKYARDAFFSFLVNAAYLNCREGEREQNYSMLIHTSGKRADHKIDAQVFEKTIASLINHESTQFDAFIKRIWEIACERYGHERADDLTSYVVGNVSRYAIFVLNSDRDFVQNGQSATNPSALFTIIIGGNIVSRGVTFENLLSMYFTRDVRHKMQQDTYIQRARMFGSRGAYLECFELTIPDQLYADWHRCFVFHRLALSAIQQNHGSPVWLTDQRIAAVSSSSIDRSTVDMNRGEMAFRLFDYDDQYDRIISEPIGVVEKLERIAAAYGPQVFPGYLKEYMVRTSADPDVSIALHSSTSIAGYTSGVDMERIERRKGFIGNPQLEKARFPNAVHHVKVFFNAKGKGRLFYKYEGSIQFMKNSK